MDRPVLLDKVATESSAGAASGQALVQTSRSGIDTTTEKDIARSQSIPRPADQTDGGVQEPDQPNAFVAACVTAWEALVKAALNVVSGSEKKQLEGRSLFIFGPENPLRKALKWLLHQEIVAIFVFLLLVLNFLFLIIKLSTPRENDLVWGAHWTDYGLLAVFGVYTLEMLAKIIVCGLILFPKTGLPTTAPTSTTDSNNANGTEKPQVPFLRSTFNRMDVIAVACFWIDYSFLLLGIQEIYIFKALAALRTFRLINTFFSSWTPLHSLKKSVPLLLNIALSIAFLFFIFSLVGVQSFKGSFTRRCVLQANQTEVLEDQFCGGYYNASDPRGKSSYLTIDGHLSSTAPKGYTCPENYVCKDTGINYDRDLSFDSIVPSMIQVYILMTGQGWTDMMHKIMNSEHGWSSIYFVLVILIMNFWILNLFVAVIIESEAMSDKSGDGSNKKKNTSESTEDQWKKNQLRKMEFFWVLAIIADIVFQCQPEYKSPLSQIRSIDQAELWFSILFALDIAIRFTVWPSASKRFFSSKKNNVDTFLVIATLIIQIPPIRRSSAYVYLTIFQVMRIYRPIMYVKSLRDLIRRVIGGMADIFRLIGFIAVFLGVASVMAGLLFRNIIPNDATGNMTFSDFYVIYLGMYQIFSGESWTDILYDFMSAEMPLHQVVVATAFIIAFYSFANFVLANMIIAIIMDNFAEEEDKKHELQIKNYAALKGYRKEKEEAFKEDLEGYLKQHEKPVGVHHITTSAVSEQVACEFFFTDTTLFLGDDGKGRYKASEEPEYRHSSSCKCQGPSGGIRRTWKDGIWERMRQRSLFIFGPENRIRKFCQKFVDTGRGSRKKDQHEKKSTKLTRKVFSFFIRLVIIASVVVAMTTTPVWRYQQAMLSPEERSDLVANSDYVFMGIFTLEFLIHIIADGLILTPDAYLRTLWNQIDFFVLLSLYAPLVAKIVGFSMTSRFFRSIKALRALRLINVSDYIKGTFHAVLVSGFPQLLDATMLCIVLLIPFAIYGMRLFSGRFFSCNDTINVDLIRGVDDCVGTFTSETGFIMPRVWSNPHEYSFNNIGASFLVLLEIVSQDGWIGVMGTARNIVGLGLQPVQDASRYNGIFFMIFNLAGGYFVTSLFVAIVIENYSKRTGMAYMTAEQLRWKNLEQFLRSMKMSKAKKRQPPGQFRAFCFNIVAPEGAEHPKKGWFARLLAFITFLNGIILASENVDAWNREGVKNAFFLTFLLIYVFEIVALISAFGWRTYGASKWNIYNGVVTALALLATFMRISGLNWQILVQAQKLLMTAILFRLVPRSDGLNRLFMTMAASLEHILKLLGAWLVVFAVYGIIFMEVFGLTAYGPNGSEHVNFRSISTTLLVLVGMSTGEGWRDLMHDFSMDKNLCVNRRDDYLQSSCGSTQWAYTLFITFNVISMYIFTNMFIAEVMQKFSYVYPTTQFTRNDLRSFKMAWDEIDNTHDGYITEKDLGKFLSKLRGFFEVRIHKEGRNLVKLREILESPKSKDVSAGPTGKGGSKKLIVDTFRRISGTLKKNIKARIIRDRRDLIDQEYNVEAFNLAMAKLDKEDEDNKAMSVQQRRRVYEFLYREVVMTMKNRNIVVASNTSANKDSKEAAQDSGENGVVQVQHGIAFHKMLLTVARYTLAKDESCFSIEEQLLHRQRMEVLHRVVNEILAKSVRRKIIPRLRFLMYRQKVLSIQARIKDLYPASPPTSPASPTSGQEGEDKRQLSGNGSGGGAPPTRRRSSVWIRPKNPISEIPSDEKQLTADEADAEIRKLRSTWKLLIMKGDQLFDDNPSVDLLFGDGEFLVQDVSQTTSSYQSMPIGSSGSTGSNTLGHSHDQSSGSSESSKDDEIQYLQV